MRPRHFKTGGTAQRGRSSRRVVHLLVARPATYVETRPFCPHCPHLQSLIMVVATLVHANLQQTVDCLAGLQLPGMWCRAGQGLCGIDGYCAPASHCCCACCLLACLALALYITRCACPFADGRSALDVIMSKWTERQIEVRPAAARMLRHSYA